MMQICSKDLARRHFGTHLCALAANWRRHWSCGILFFLQLRYDQS